MSVSIPSFLDNYDVYSPTQMTVTTTGTPSTNTTTIGPKGYYTDPVLPVGGVTGTVLSALGSYATDKSTFQSNIATIGPLNPLPAIDINLTYTFTPGRYIVDPSTFATGSNITFDAVNNPSAQFAIISASNITLPSLTAINLIRGATNCNVFWSAGTSITFTGSSPPYIPGVFVTGTETITFASPSNVQGRLYANTAVTFVGISSVTGTCDVEPPFVVVCYAKGTKILTKQGFVPIENIKAGQQVVTKGKIHKNQFINKDSMPRLEPVFWVSKFKVIDLNSKSRPICIKKDALGKNYPFEDLYVSPGHSLLLNGKMVLAKYIVNGETIYQDNECESVEYYHIECENHSAIFANGVLSESYLDVNNRDVFENSIRLRRKYNLRTMSYSQ